MMVSIVSVSVSVNVCLCVWVFACLCVPLLQGWCTFTKYGVLSFHLVLHDIGLPHLFFSSILMMAHG